mmetsp:Transcript_32409/g.91836  ORF Transcript_32409/g.91836 Transcript_32409/m.91836 type:complete len:253 (+) Transcript_32409:2944-3702(+)
MSQQGVEDAHQQVEGAHKVAVHRQQLRLAEQEHQPSEAEVGVTVGVAGGGQLKLGGEEVQVALEEGAHEDVAHLELADLQAPVQGLLALAKHLRKVRQDLWGHAEQLFQKLGEREAAVFRQLVDLQVLALLSVAPVELVGHEDDARPPELLGGGREGHRMVGGEGRQRLRRALQHLLSQLPQCAADLTTDWRLIQPAIIALEKLHGCRLLWSRGGSDGAHLWKHHLGAEEAAAAAAAATQTAPSAGTTRGQE